MSKKLIGGVITLFCLVLQLVAYSENPEAKARGFVSLKDVVPNIVLDIRYYSNYNFVGTRIDGYEEPIALVTQETAWALSKVNKELEPLGYTLKVYDAYRPQRAVNHFISWAKVVEDTRMKEYFYPELDKSVLFDQGYIGRRSGHSRGSTVDLTICSLLDGTDLDMGGSFDYFGEKSHPDYPYLTEEQRQNRELLRNLMLKHGFAALNTEWWHFTLIEEPYPSTYFDFPVCRP